MRSIRSYWHYWRRSKSTKEHKEVRKGFTPQSGVNPFSAKSTTIVLLLSKCLKLTLQTHRLNANNKVLHPYWGI